MQQNLVFGDQITRLFPFVDETKTPLPRGWSARDKWQSIGVSQNNLRVTYRGQGKTHKDAAAVRATHSIPATCGIYYFEVRIVSKGRDGYMGIGLCQKEVSLNRLPGWDRYSYGYHGDDGNFFCSSGSGVPYGPTFTTGDVIGCGLNLVDNTCFYTKNGQHLGTAFQDLPNELYPTVGLQTPGEIVDTNFGQQPFMYNIENDIREAQVRVRTAILNFPVPSAKTSWFNKLVSSYLVHHGYSATAESFNGATDQKMREEIISMKNRQRIQKMVLSGRISDAIYTVNQLHPGLLDRNLQLLFLLKCRQFVEMVAGVDSEIIHRSSPRSSPPSDSSSGTPPHKGSVCAPYSIKSRPSPIGSPRDSPHRYSPRGRIKSPRSRNSPFHPGSGADEAESSALVSSTSLLSTLSQDNNMASNGVSSSAQNGCAPSFSGADQQSDVSPMEYIENGTNVSNGAAVDPTIADLAAPCSSSGDDAGSAQNGASDDGMMDSEDCSSVSSGVRVVAGGNIERLIEFGKGVVTLSKQLKPPQSRHVIRLKKKMENVFSLLAYPDPYNSPQGEIMDPSQREQVAAALNSAILEELGHASRPSLEVLTGHGRRLRDQLASNSFGAATFADPDELTRLNWKESFHRTNDTEK